MALYGLYFDTAKADVKPESKDTLEQMARLLKNASSSKLLVVGHTDDVGEFSGNMELSKRRAEAVVAALVNQYKVDRKRLTPVGVSFASPMASNDTEEGKAKNRRVELVPNHEKMAPGQKNGSRPRGRPGADSPASSLRFRQTR